MARPAQYSAQGILDAAAELASARGPAAATIGAIADSLGAPTGSIYHRFRSRDVLLAELWLQTVESFQIGFQVALAGPEAREAGLEAALYTPRWARAHPLPARLLLLHRQDDFVHNGWPPEMVERGAGLTSRGEAVMRSFTRRALGSTSAAAQRRARYAVVELPVAAAIPHVRANEPLPLTVEDLIADTYRALIPGSK